MVAIDFPTNPALDDSVTLAGTTYVFNGTGWTVMGDSNSHTVGDTPPANPDQGDLWFESDTMILWIWYVDPTGGQWVQAAGNSGGATGDFVLKTGDTMTGTLKIQSGGALEVSSANHSVAVSADASSSVVAGTLNGLSQWSMALGNSTTDLVVLRYDDAGAVIPGAPLTINRATGVATFDSQVISNNSFDARGVAPHLMMSKPVGGTNMLLGRLDNGEYRWSVKLGDDAAETGGNAGSNFVIERYANGGTAIGQALSIDRATGHTTLYDNVIVLGAGLGPAFPSALFVGWDANSRNGLSIRPTVDGIGAAVDFRTVAGATCGTIQTTATTTAYNTASSAELKDDLKSFDAGNIVDNTNVYDFAWKETGTRSYGVIAQQANEVYPQAVTHIAREDEPEFWGIDYSKYVPVLLQELKSLRARVAEQAADIAALKAHTGLPGITPSRKA